MTESRTDILAAAYAEGVKTALLDAGYPDDAVDEFSVKVAAEAGPSIELNVSPTASIGSRGDIVRAAPEARRSILERVMTGAPVGATAAVLAGGALGLGRTPVMRRQFMKALRRKKDGGVLQALKEMTSKPSNQEQIRSLAIPGAVGGGILGAISGT